MRQMKKIIYLIPAICILFLCNCDEKKKAEPQKPPVAAFSADQTLIQEGQTVYFTDQSSNDPTGWAWNFGDDPGTTVHSSAQSPSHTYSTAGTYTVILAVANDAGDDALVKTNYITVYALVEAAFTANSTNINEGESVQFTDQSTGVPTGWSWDFGDGTISTQQNPTHTYYSAGVYNVSLTANNSSSSDTESKSNYITVNELVTTDITFNNPVFTDIYITLNGDTKTISPDGSVTFYNVSGSSVYYSAYTYGKTSGGTQIGLQIEWSNTLTLSGGTDSYNLVVGSDKFFLYMRNDGTHVLINLYVNYGLNSETYDNILVPTDNINYRIGYYKAWTNSNVRMYYQDAPTAYTYWDQGTHFTLPWTNNQKAELYNSHKKSSVEGTPVKINSNPEFLIPETKTNSKLVFDKNAVKLYCK